jgi:predicted aldo/keto reductase-like oxidoreductase
MELVIASGINHIDVAPSYGQAQERLGPWVKTERDRFFLGCKTMERTKETAHRELHQSLERLFTNRFDLYQFHAVNTMAKLDQITRPGGAMEAVLEAKEEGLLSYVGITGHGLEVPRIFLEALRRFRFDSVLFPLNFILFSNPDYLLAVNELLLQCSILDVGVMTIKSIAKGPWGENQKANTTWYEPFTNDEWIQKCIHFSLSQPVTGVCTPADVSLLPVVIKACETFRRMDTSEQGELIAQASNFAPLFN